MPEHEAAILAKYGLASPGTRAALDERWRAQLAAEAQTRAELGRLIAAYKDWLLLRPR